jgi:CRP-like cAMP-binding protein
MRKTLYILADLNEADVRWLAEAGAVIEASDGEVLIRAGEPVPHLCIVLDGAMKVQRPDGIEVARLAVGEIVGEMSLIEKRLPGVDVVAAGAARLLAVDQSLLRARLEDDPAFAARFYRALAVFLSDRLRGTVARLGYGDDSTGDADRFAEENELDEGVLDTIHVAGDRMRRLLALLEGRET